MFVCCLFYCCVGWVFVGFELLLIGCLLLICVCCLGLLVIVLHISLSFLLFIVTVIDRLFLLRWFVVVYVCLFVCNCCVALVGYLLCWLDLRVICCLLGAMFVWFDCWMFVVGLAAWYCWLLFIALLVWWLAFWFVWLVVGVFGLVVYCV